MAKFKTGFLLGALAGTCYVLLTTKKKRSGTHSVLRRLL